MIEKYISVLTNQLNKKNNDIKNIDLVIDGGAFNGGYMIGCVSYLKYLDKINYIKIDRISGCSIGSLLGFLYLMDRLDEGQIIYERLLTHYKKHLNLKIIHSIIDDMKKSVSCDCYLLCNNKLFISYIDVKRGRHVIKSTYKNNDELFDILKRSIHIPFVLDGTLKYKNKYIDGLYPYIFKNKRINTILNTNNPQYIRKVLFINTASKIYYLSKMMDVKTEKTYNPRILLGIIDIHAFFDLNHNTSFCCYMDEFNIITPTLFWVRKKVVGILIYYIKIFSIIISIIMMGHTNKKIKKYVHKTINHNNIIHKIVTGIIKHFLI
jgi:hypothetical protein